jgi:hypothetical protein
MTSLDVLGRREVRASDADRESCTRALRDHYAAGRLDHEDLEERLALATRARTTNELRALLRDLPRPPRRGGMLSRAAVRSHAAVFVAVNGGLTGIWAATGEGTYWPGGVLAPWAAFLAGHVMMRRAARNIRRRTRP